MNVARELNKLTLEGDVAKVAAYCDEHNVGNAEATLAFDNASDATGETALFRAVTDKRKEALVELLLERGANRAATGKQGRSVLDAARGERIRQLLATSAR